MDREVENSILEKAKDLSLREKCEVTAFSFIIGKDTIVGFIKNPSRLDKMRAIDTYEHSRTQAGDLILRTSLLQDVSDKRILDESPDNDPIYLGAIGFAIKMVQIANEQLKKK